MHGQANKLKIWLPYVRCGTGTDVFTQSLARGLQSAGHQVVLQPISHQWQYFPWRLKLLPVPDGTHVVIANSWNGFAFARPHLKLIVVEHHCIFDPIYTPYRSFVQGLFHEIFVRRFELKSFSRADAIVAVSQYTAKSLKESLDVEVTEVIYNGIDVGFFSPESRLVKQSNDEVFRLLFVGNLSARKGADLLPEIMDRLGDGFELKYTSGLMSNGALADQPNTHHIGRLSQQDLQQAYVDADALLLPSRLEGFGYVAVESMACGTPVIATRCSSLPEVIEDGVTGLLFNPEDIDAAVEAIRELAGDRKRRLRLGKSARMRAENEFSIDRMTKRYLDLLQRVLEK